MVREEAIEYGTGWLKDEYLDAKDRAFIKTALEVLKQEPCEDCISREAVIDTCLNICFNGYKEKDLIHDIKNLPPVTSQPKMGWWILTSDDDYEYCTCSECGYQNGENWMIGSQVKFCSNCGAKMGVEE